MVNTEQKAPIMSFREVSTILPWLEICYHGKDGEPRGAEPTSAERAVEAGIRGASGMALGSGFVGFRDCRV